jgi:hypothetical protein
MSSILAPTSTATRLLAAASVALAVMAAALVLDAPRQAAADHPPECEAIDLGELMEGAGASLTADGRWTTEDCDSRFRADSDAFTYRFSAEAGRIRIELASSEADAFLYLLAEDGSRITQNDDGGEDIDARIERDLAAGVYLVEATTVGGRGRGEADFTLSVSRVPGCGTTDLGMLEAGTDLTASGSWTLDTCGSRFVAAHPAHGYSFTVAEPGLVRVDLMSENGDPVLSLVSPTLGVIGANDDGGGGRNARIEQYLPAGPYIIEATTYLERDLQPLEADFELVVSLVDEDARQLEFQLKVEAVHIPDMVIAGQPFGVHYRVGNLGGGALADAGGSAFVYTVAPRLFERTPLVPGSDDRWQAGVAYHSGPETASSSSVAIDELPPLTVTFSRPGPAWLFTAVYIQDEEEDEIGWHGLWRTFMVLSGPTFETLTVSVDGEEYLVAPVADNDGVVTYWVVSGANPVAEVDDDTSAKALYAAATHALALDGIFDRPAVAALGDEPAAPDAPERAPIALANPSSTTLLEALGLHYVAGLAASGLLESVAAGNVITADQVDALVLAAADAAAAQYAPIAARWATLLDRIEEGGVLTFEEAFAVQSELAYVESVASPLITAGEVVRAARASEAGWEDPAVQAIADGIASEGVCRAPSALGDALTRAGASDVDAALALDAELRGALVARGASVDSAAYGLALDAALCAISGIDAANSELTRTLDLQPSAVQAMLAPERPASEPPSPPLPPAAPEPLSLRIVGALAEDGRVEFTVQLPSGAEVGPNRRFFGTEPDDRRWYFSSDVELNGSPIGIIRARYLADGRIEVGFDDADGNSAAIDVRYLPADLAPGGDPQRDREPAVLLRVTACPPGASRVAYTLCP